MNIKIQPLTTLKKVIITIQCQVEYYCYKSLWTHTQVYRFNNEHKSKMIQINRKFSFKMLVFSFLSLNNSSTYRLLRWCLSLNMIGKNLVHLPMHLFFVYLSNCPVIICYMTNYSYFFWYILIHFLHVWWNWDAWQWVHPKYCLYVR